jgi:hypothetical protein
VWIIDYCLNIKLRYILTLNCNAGDVCFSKENVQEFTGHVTLLAVMMEYIYLGVTSGDMHHVLNVSFPSGSLRYTVASSITYWNCCRYKIYTMSHNQEINCSNVEQNGNRKSKVFICECSTNVIAVICLMHKSWRLLTDLFIYKTCNSASNVCIL